MCSATFLLALTADQMFMEWYLVVWAPYFCLLHMVNYGNFSLPCGGYC